VFRRFIQFTCRFNRAVTCPAALCLLCGPAVHADVQPKPAQGKAVPGVLFSTLLPELPGKRLVAANLELDPKLPRPFKAHRHPGSVYVYVTKGAVRFGIEGQPVQLVHAGESFFEPAGALHTVAENASATEPASAIAVLIVPDGAPLTSVDEPSR
jgi:quercetin dioxygenase-like cupin family protein